MEGLGAAEMRGMRALCDAFLPADPSAWRASIPERCAAVLLSHPDPDDRSRARLFLRLLEIAPASLILGRRWGPFSALAPEDARAYLERLATHPLGLIRGAFQATRRLITVTYYADVDEARSNPVWARIGYPGPLLHPNVPARLRSMRIERDTELDCDVVVVGSGAGGGVLAAELAAAGQDVIVLEKGGHHETGDVDQLEVPSFRRLYLDGGLTATADQGVILLAGSCLGGGTVVNYTTSFATPDAVRDEWARISGLDVFSAASFTRSLDAVCARVGVNTDHGAPSSRDALMEAGLRASGWHVAAMPRDVSGCTQDDVCGYCGFGCARDAKRSTLRTYLEDAAAHRARLVVECEAQRVVVERGTAVGVEARSRTGARVRVRARAVVAAAGAVGTAALLLRSGLTGEVGQGLRLHPVTAVWGLFDQDVRPWTGTIQSRYSNELADLDDGFGVRFETAPVHPAFQALGAAWAGADAFDATMRELPRTSLVGLLVRDREPGRVSVARSGRPVLRYGVSRYDQRHVRRGVDAAACVLLAAGARRVRSMQSRPVVLDAGGSVDEWLARADRVGYGSNRTTYVTFHQMGTCRMGADPTRGAVDGAGESHEVRRLFVADGSLFPSASGVNPMITIMALAHHVAQEMKARL